MEQQVVVNLPFFGNPAAQILVGIVALLAAVRVLMRLLKLLPFF